ISPAGTTSPALRGTRPAGTTTSTWPRSEEHTSELQSQFHLVCRLLLEKIMKRVEPRTVLRTGLAVADARLLPLDHTVLDKDTVTFRLIYNSFNRLFVLFFLNDPPPPKIYPLPLPAPLPI